MKGEIRRWGRGWVGGVWTVQGYDCKVRTHRAVMLRQRAGGRNKGVRGVKGGWRGKGRQQQLLLLWVSRVTCSTKLLPEPVALVMAM